MIHSRSHVHPCIEVKQNQRKGGHGIFATDAIPSGTVLLVWGGEIVDESRLNNVPAYQRRFSVQIEEGLYLLSDSTREPADFLNHSCNPNAGMRGQISVVAMRDIIPGEEICIDYAMCDGSPYDEFNCDCGSPYCRKRVTGRDWLEEEIQTRYKGFFSPYLQCRIDMLAR